jgi:cellulose synthase/poly-beta-1,6-N-acetylglucosamine synthase-like glycosyltransferase
MNPAIILLVSFVGIVAAAYVFIITLFTFGWFRKSKNRTEVPTLSSNISIIIAARNEEHNISACLDVLASQDYPKDNFEIIIIDDASTDHTMQIVKEFIQTHQEIRTQLFSLAEKDRSASSKKAALSLGIQLAQFEIIAVTDADCIPAHGWIRVMANGFSERTVMMVCGMVCFSIDKKWFSKLQSLEFMSLVASGAGASGAGFPFMCNGASMAFRKEAFYNTGAYSDSEGYASGDDVFLLHNIKKIYGNSSVQFIKNISARIVTAPQPSLIDFYNQRVRWASKSKGYHDIISLLTSVAVFVYSLEILLFAAAGIFFAPMLYAASGLFILKVIIDFPLMAGITAYFGQKKLLFFYLPMQLIYPAYIVIVALGGIFGKYSWKGRTL